MAHNACPITVIIHPTPLPFHSGQIFTGLFELSKLGVVDIKFASRCRPIDKNSVGPSILLVDAIDHVTSISSHTCFDLDDMMEIVGTDILSNCDVDYKRSYDR